MIKTILLSGFLYCLSFTVQAQERDTVRWISFEQLSDSLHTHPKKVLLFFHTDWCAYCRKMQNEIFTDGAIARYINDHYYAVRFDAETTDTVHFDQQVLTNDAKKKRTGAYHDMAKLLASRNGNFVFPVTLVLEKDFRIKNRYFEYLDKKKLMKILQ